MEWRWFCWCSVRVRSHGAALFPWCGCRPAESPAHLRDRQLQPADGRCGASRKPCVGEPVYPCSCPWTSLQPKAEGRPRNAQWFRAGLLPPSPVSVLPETPGPVWGRAVPFGELARPACWEVLWDRFSAFRPRPRAAGPWRVWVWATGVPAPGLLKSSKALPPPAAATCHRRAACAPREEEEGTHWAGRGDGPIAGSTPVRLVRPRARPHWRPGAPQQRVPLPALLRPRRSAAGFCPGLCGSGWLGGMRAGEALTAAGGSPVLCWFSFSRGGARGGGGGQGWRGGGLQGSWGQVGPSGIVPVASSAAHVKGTQWAGVISNLVLLFFHLPQDRIVSHISKTSKMAFQLLVFIDSLNFRKDHSGPFSLIMKTGGQ